MNATKNNKVKLGTEMLEGRELMSVTSALLTSTGIVTVKTDSAATTATVKTDPMTGGIKIVDGTNGKSYPFTGVSEVRIYGGAGDDYFANYAPSVTMRAWGYGGNDYLVGDGKTDYLYGGEGNDKLDGWGGNDRLYGGNGNDRLRGMDGLDYLYGEGGNDSIIGAAGADKLYGGDGDDTLVNIDGSTTDTADGGNGRDTVWYDATGLYADAVINSELNLGVASFANAGADRTLDGDRIPDPIDVTNPRNYRNNPLFADAGPSRYDIDQNGVSDCWILAPLGAAVNDNQYVAREMVADFGDGTYGVRLGSNFYRVDADLETDPVTGKLTYAGLGIQNSLWVAIVEKAYATHRTGANTYASLNFGDPQDAFRAFNLNSTGGSSYAAGTEPSIVANDLYNHWYLVNNSATIHTGTVPSGSKLFGLHAYSVVSMELDSAGSVSKINVRNPWGFDSGTPEISLTPQELAACQISIRWGISV